jgi:cellulose synthase/poly-beta-1,6-N-acetylglucosamine synthase-like glycosyltransferase/peptidoglycan/xylan/chitin deacetylase (PgdA/CDA1 family)/spore germination protein YaaH
MAGQSFVFHDPSGKRWARFRRAFGVAGIAATVLIVILALSLVSKPQLPTLGLQGVGRFADFGEVPTITRGEKAAKAAPFRFHKPREVKYVRNGGNPVVHPRTAFIPRADQPVVFGFYVNWDPASMVSLRVNLSRMTHLVPEWLALKNGNGDVEDQSDNDVIRIANDAKLPILAEINNFRDGWQAGDLARVLNNSTARENLVDNIYSNLVEHKFAGVNVDFEQLSERNREQMVTFMEELHAKLKPAGLILTESVPVDDQAYDLKRLGEINDYIVPMIYDEHYQTSEPGPVASEDWFVDQLDRVAKTLPPSKTVIGFGNYGYDWVIGSRKGGAEVSYGDVIAAAEANKNGKVAWDTNEENPVLRYENGGERHEIWFLDAVTALNQIQDISDGMFRGVALWRLGAEDPGMWSVFGAAHSWPDEKFNPVQLFKLTAQRSVQQYGSGEVLRITDEPHDGARNVWKEKDGDFAETYQHYPSYYVVDSTAGANEKLMAITFDDGPSEYTSRVLDILKQKQVPATFFVIGVNAEEFPSMIQREYAEGHTIGNHTYSHPNIAGESEQMTELELNTTQRLIEHDIGHSTRLFRPPYNADSHPQTPNEIVPIDRAQKMGYITVAETIDPRDWEIGTNANKILSDVLEQKEDGHLILLHDGGGDRSPTLQALPQIIDTLRAQGYRFVPLEQLMGKSRDQLMPVPSQDERRWASIEGEALVTKGTFKKVLGLLFLMALYLTLLRSLVYGGLAIAQKIKARKRKFDPGFQPSVSVVIAAYNEEKVIERTVQAVLDNGYPELEVVVVDDGSKDATLAVLENAFAANPQVRIFTQPNRGKASALNHAIREAQNNILVALDADTIFRKGTIGMLGRHFSDERVGAVSGNARVGNRNKWITRFQSVEYICGFNLDRRALDLMNAITVVPGAAGAWRKDLILRVGGFGDDTLAEDTDLTLAIRRLGYAIRYEENAVAYTEAPEATKDLAKQRFRWAFGTLQAAWKHRDATFNPNYGWLGWVALPSIWIFQVLLAALSPFAEVAMIVALFSGNWRIVLLYYFGLFLLELATAILSFALERVPAWDLALLFFQRIYYRQLMYFVLAKSILYAMRGRLVGWGKLERRATVTA